MDKMSYTAQTFQYEPPITKHSASIQQNISSPPLVVVYELFFLFTTLQLLLSFVYSIIKYHMTAHICFSHLTVLP